MSTEEQDPKQEPQRDAEHTEQHGGGDNVDTQVNESPDVEVVVEQPAEGTSTGESDPGQGGDGSGGESK
jgi:hypothetical protein